MTGEAMTDAQDATGIFCWGDRKRGETSCIILLLSTHQIHTNMVLTFYKAGRGKDTCGLADANAGGYTGGNGYGGGW